MRFFDTHAHYDDERFDADRDELFAAMAEDTVALILNPGCDMETSRKALGYAKKYPHVYAAVGYHPENCAPFCAADLDELRAMAREEKVVAIGAIGLDYYWEQTPSAEFQQQVFRAHMALAEELNLPVIVHDREAHADTLAIVKEFPCVKGVFHCFSGSVEMMRELVKLGWYVGLDGPVTYKNARKALEVAEAVPLERLLIETDAPYMAPVPVRGTRNDSRNLFYIAEAIAKVRGISVEEVAEATLANGKRLFRIA